ncbi:hypothetical protein ACFVH6_14745 [Spirillospora sp. NPDC127200]
MGARGPLILQELVQRDGHRQSLLPHRAAPWIVAFFYYHVSWLLMECVAEQPELEDRPAPGTYAAEYGHYASPAGLLRQIGHDERGHKTDSLVHLSNPRFQDA